MVMMMMMVVHYDYHYADMIQTARLMLIGLHEEKQNPKPN